MSCSSELRLPIPSWWSYFAWAELMRRVLVVDVLVCDHCGGRRKVLTFITDSHVIRRVLTHMGLPTEMPAVVAAHSPPRTNLPFD